MRAARSFMGRTRMGEAWIATHKPQSMREGGAMPNGETQGCRGVLEVASCLA